MGFFFRLYRWLNILSIDVAGGAAVGALFFARVFKVNVLPQGLWVLSLTVWIIYTADHLLDARKIKQPASTERHRFHQQHFILLAGLVVAVSVADLVLIFYIRSVVFFQGLLLSVWVVLYFLIQQRIGFLKEMAGAVLYTSGVLLIPLALDQQLTTAGKLLIAQFAITAWINLLLFSWIDQPRDTKDKHVSFATVCGPVITRYSLLFLFLVNGILCGVSWLITAENFAPTSIIILMNLILLFIFFKHKLFEENDRFRLLGDAVFLFPLIYLFWGHAA
ncbi:MAG: hypothetical protein JSS93_00130 [Bacteroidetes bacterium]|nr:hypothetical protein [Bacteroidota bacterium]